MFFGRQLARLLAVIVVVSALVMGTIAPVSAQDETTNPPTTEPAPPVTPVPNDPLVNEGASDELDPNSTPEDPAGAPVDAPAEVPEGGAQAGDQSCVASAEDDAGASTGTAVCPVKRTGRYSGQPAFVPDSLNTSELRRVGRELEQAQVVHVTNVSRVRSLRLHDKKLQLEKADLSAATVETLEMLEATEEQLRRRALASFVQGDSFSLAPSLEHDDILRHQQQQFLVGEVFALDEDLLQEYTRLRNRLEAETLDLYDRIAAVRSWLRGANTDAEESASEMDRLEYEYATWEYLSSTWIEDVVFPIDGSYDLPLINSWGYPRAPGTVDEHWHEGIDIFAPEGEILVAAEGGEVTDIGVGTLGGLKIWILGNSGTRWYYAHLMDFNPDLRVGDIVKAGDFIGYVGKTGNAMSTPPHLHLQMHPDGGRPVNPYPILQAASDRYQAGVRPEPVPVVTLTGSDGTRLLPNGSTEGQLTETRLSDVAPDDVVRVDGAIQVPETLVADSGTANQRDESLSTR